MDISNVISADFNVKYKLCRFLVFFGAGLAIVSFIAFPAVGFGLGFGAGKEIFPWILFPFIGVILGMVCLMVSIMRLNKLKRVKQIIDAIKATDKVFIFQLAGAASLEAMIRPSIKKMVDVGLLEGYSVIADVLVAKDELGISDEAAMKEYNATNPMIKFSAVGKAYCRNCGTEINAEDAFCPKCGAEQRR